MHLVYLCSACDGTQLASHDVCATHTLIREIQVHSMQMYRHRMTPLLGDVANAYTRNCSGVKCPDIKLHSMLKLTALLELYMKL